MTTTPSARRRPAGAVLVAIVLLGLTACTDPAAKISPTSTITNPAPTRTGTPTPLPTPTPTDPKDINIAAAKATYAEYYGVVQEVQQRPAMAGWETELMPYIGSDELGAFEQNFYSQASAQGLRQTAPGRIVSMTVTTYLPDPTNSGNERVAMDVCLDNTGTDIVDPNGKSVTQPGFPKRLIDVVQMQRQTTGVWKVAKDTTAQDRPC